MVYFLVSEPEGHQKHICTVGMYTLCDGKELPENWYVEPITDCFTFKLKTICDDCYKKVMEGTIT